MMALKIVLTVASALLIPLTSARSTPSTGAGLVVSHLPQSHDTLVNPLSELLP